jgi:hypothetical protein
MQNEAVVVNRALTDSVEITAYIQKWDKAYFYKWIIRRFGNLRWRLFLLPIRSKQRGTHSGSLIRCNWSEIFYANTQKLPAEIITTLDDCRLKFPAAVMAIRGRFSNSCHFLSPWFLEMK